MSGVALTVLLVDPSKESASAIQNSFSRFGPYSYELFHVVRLASAADILSRYAVDIVLLDPFVADATDLASDLTRLRAQTDAPIIVITDVECFKTAELATRTGAVDYVVKGTLTGQALMRTLRQAVERHGMATQLERQRREEEAAKERFHNLIASNADAMLVIDGEGIIRFANPVAEDLLARPGSELVGSRFGIPSEGAGGTEINVVRPSGIATTAEMLVMETEWDGEPAYIATLRDISTRKAAERALNVAKQQAEQANEMKSQFLANMSHELRTPLNSILGFAQMINAETYGPVGNEKYADYVGSIHDSGQHLLTLINDLLDLSRAEAGKLALDVEDVDLERLLRREIELLQGQIEQANVQVSTDFQLPEGTQVRGDKRKLRQIALNLLSNAIKFSNTGGWIAIETRLTADNELQFSVSDNGVGIRREEIPRLFTAYIQVDMPEVRKQRQGAGLGLAICKNFVELHGGTITIDSQLGEGTCVTVTLPASRVRAGIDSSDVTQIGLAAKGY